MLENIFKNKTILVTGGTGSIGLEIVRQLLKYGPAAIRIFARHEDRHFRIMHEFGLSKSGEVLRFMIGDVRDKDRLRMAMEGADIVFHAAALKHVPMCEYNPFEAVKTNILGTQNVVELARELNVERVVAISTDKVIDPTSVLGTSKLMGEKLMLATYYYKGDKKTKFACVRFGNVLGSRGSILMVVKNQIAEGGSVSVTDPKMTRFIMTIPQAVDLVLGAARISEGHEIFVLKMPSVRVGDLVDAAVEYYAPFFGKKPKDIKIETIGKRNGEKDHERLLADHELPQVLETKSMYIITPHKNFAVPEYKGAYRGTTRVGGRKFLSQYATKLSRRQLLAMIKEADKNPLHFN